MPLWVSIGLYGAPWGSLVLNGELQDPMGRDPGPNGAGPRAQWGGIPDQMGGPQDQMGEPQDPMGWAPGPNQQVGPGTQ